MKQIVVATDFSNCASNAMEYAVELAKILNAEICALHAIRPTEGIDNSVYNAIFIEDYYANKKQSLANWANTFVSKDDYKDIKVTTVCEVGNVVSVISKYVETNDVELLVMGTTGGNEILGLFGSIASTIVEKTNKPTLVVPLESKFSTDPVITLATDFSADLSGGDATALTELLIACKSAKLTVLNVLETREWKPNEKGENKMKELVGNTDIEFKYMHEDNVMEGIMNYLVSSNTDIVCLVKHHHNVLYRLFNSSTVNKMVNKSVKAVLVLHD